MPHTSGPWTFQPDKTFSNLGDQRIVGANRISPAIVFGGLGPETDANANLIAAAPDLLEAAKHAAMEWRLHGQLTDSCRVLEKAILKAEGSASPAPLEGNK